MIKPNIALAFLLTGLLAACGGDSGDSVVPETGTGTGTGDDGTTGTVDNGDGSTDDITTGTNITNPRLGSGTGASYAPQLTTSLTSLPVGGSTNISATIVDSDRNNAKVVSKLYGIRFSSGCSQSVPPKASFSKDEVITSGGEVTVTYTAEGCSTGTDTVTFSLFNVADGAITGDNPLHSLTTTLTIARPDVQSISYVGNSSPAIGLAGIGNSVLPTVSDVTFRVIDVNGNPLEGTAVSFELSPENSLAVISPAQQTTGPNGEVKVSVSSGSVQATVRVKATATTNAGELIEVESSPIAIVKGLVQQIGFSLSADKFNPDAFSKDGTTVSLGVIAYDYAGNAAPDGTAINFVAESGFIEPASCTTVGGTCSVNWQSGGLRPGVSTLSSDLLRSNEVEAVGGDQVLGMTTIMAYALGEAGFTDLNNNGLYDSGEPKIALAEAFLDNNFDGVFDSIPVTGVQDHIFIDIDGDSQYSGTAPSTYQGVMCSEAAKADGHCSSVVHVRSSIRIVQSDSRFVPTYEIFDSDFNRITPPYGLSANDNTSFYVVFRDVNGNTLPNGTTVSVSGDGYKIRSSHISGDNSPGYLIQNGDIPERGLMYSFSLQVEDALEAVNGIEFNLSGPYANDVIFGPIMIVP